MNNLHLLTSVSGLSDKPQSNLKLAYAVIAVVLIVRNELFKQMVDKRETLSVLCHSLVIEPNFERGTCPDYEELVKYHFPSKKK